LRIVLIAVAVAVCSSAWPVMRLLARPYRCADCNVVLVSIECLRADHVGAYGYERPTTPYIDAFAADAVRFANAIAQGSSTTYSHGSMLTSLIPQHHGASGHRRTPFRPYVATLPQILTAAGWLSVSFNGGAMLRGELGFGSGFAVYDSNQNGTLAERSRAAIAWLRGHRSHPFFLFLHSYEAHHPYEPREELFRMLDRGYSGSLPRDISVDLLERINSGSMKLSGDDLRHIVDAYDAEVRSADEGFGVLIAALKELGLYDRTMILVTGDHGDEFGEHGRVGWHSHTVYDELLRVPLLVKFPRSWRAGEVVERQVSHVDMMPTILDVLDVPSSWPFDGRSLIGELDAGAADERAAISQCDDGKKPLTSVRNRRWKLIARKGGKARLFDLGADPSETADVADAHADVVADLQHRFEAVVAAQKSVLHPVQLPLEEKVREQLRALGYDRH
jgi:arylsulfatase A-like enzyme